tara:strand:+ start:631 stop:813 length:183 start_codon:yes stop_codon:yes gene_type:complete
MKVGDLVKFKGFKNYPVGSPVHYGIVVRVYPYGAVDILWGMGAIGMKLFAETLEVIDECR